MKKYYFTWYNYVTQTNQTDFVLAKDEKEAKQMAVLIMQLFGGSFYKEKHIDILDEVNDNYYYTMDKIKEKYEKWGKEFIPPEIKDDEED